MTQVSFVFIGGVDVSYACLAALCEAGHVPSLAIAYDDSYSHLAGFADFAPVARDHGFALERTREINGSLLRDRIRAAEPQVIFVIGWSQLLRPELLEIPRYGCVGIHPTRLPYGRGRAPIPWTILKDLRETASTMFFLTEGVDDGDVVGRVDIEIDSREDAGTLYAKHRAAHVRLVLTHVTALLEGQAPRTPQDHSLATIWPRRTPEDGRIDWSQDAQEIDRLVRASTRPFPGAFGDTSEGVLRVWRSEVARKVPAAPGTVVRNASGAYVACGSGSVRLVEVEPL
jgi:methionyl-tRNA formyltransferase